MPALTECIYQGGRGRMICQYVALHVMSQSGERTRSGPSQPHPPHPTPSHPPPQTPPPIAPWHPGNDRSNRIAERLCPRRWAGSEKRLRRWAKPRNSKGQGKRIAAQELRLWHAGLAMQADLTPIILTFSADPRDVRRISQEAAKHQITADVTVHFTPSAPLTC